MGNKCLDCNKEISIRSLRCKSCSNKHRDKYTCSEKARKNMGNGMKGKKLPKKWKENMRKSMIGKNKMEKNGMWKGDKVKYVSLHHWIENNKPKPEFCEECKKFKPYDLANISGKYKRDINDFEWLCRKCHMKKDGRINKLVIRNKDRIKSEEHKKRVQKEYYFKNKEKIKLQHNKYHSENKEHLKKKMNEYYQKNKDKFKAYKEKNKDKIKKYQKDYREMNKEKMRGD